MNTEEMRELPVIMASLDISPAESPVGRGAGGGDAAVSPNGSPEEEDEPSPKPIRSGLRRRSLPMANAAPKRRCNLKPKKLDMPSEDGEKLLNYYLNKKVNFSTRKALETIYEEPKSNRNGSLVYIGAGRQRRIAFNAESKAKLRKRKSMLKKVLTGPKVRQKRGLSMDEFLTRMQNSLSRSGGSGDNCLVP